MEEVLGIKGVKGKLPCGVGFVIIPKNLDIEEYKKDVYLSGRISIYGGYGHPNFYNILIDRDTLQRIKFPKDSSSFGSPVVWINIPKHDEPVVIASLKYDEEFFELSENRRRFTLTDKTKSLDFDLDAKKGKISLSGNGGKGKMEFDINISNDFENAIFRVNIEGETLIRSSKRIIAISEEKIEIGVSNKSGILKNKVSLKSEGETLRIEDQYGNSISVDEDRINFKSKEIINGEGNEKAVLGDTLKSILDRYDEALGRMTVPTALGPSGTRINEVEFKSIKEDFEKILSKLVKLD